VACPTSRWYLAVEFRAFDFDQAIINHKVSVKATLGILGRDLGVFGKLLAKELSQ
jgi:hypothetical protein